MGKTISRISMFLSNFERLFARQTQFCLACNFGKTCFGQFPTFHCSTPKTKTLHILIGVKHLLFLHFCEVFEQVRRNDLTTPYATDRTKKRNEQSMSKIKDLVTTIKTHTESSKSELSSGGKRPFKVWTF